MLYFLYNRLNSYSLFKQKIKKYIIQYNIPFIECENIEPNKLVDLYIKWIRFSFGVTSITLKKWY